jgi:hypothetical protein
MVDSGLDARKAGDCMIRELRPAYLKPPDRGVPPPRSGLTSLAAEPIVLSPVGLRGFDRMRQRYTVKAMTDGHVDAITAVRESASGMCVA